MGVFATRSPFRPNAIGLSCVTLEGVQWHTPQGPVLLVGGVDLLDGTPIYDIKPYLPHADCHPEATGGFAAQHADDALSVDFPPALLARIDEAQRETVCALLAQDPRPSYQDDPQRVYGMAYGRWNIRFTVEAGTAHVVDVEEA